MNICRMRLIVWNELKLIQKFIAIFRKLYMNEKNATQTVFDFSLSSVLFPLLHDK